MDTIRKGLTMTDFETIKEIYERKHINANIVDGSFSGIPMIEDFVSDITFWFNEDGSLDFIENDRKEDEW